MTVTAADQPTKSVLMLIPSDWYDGYAWQQYRKLIDSISSDLKERGVLLREMPLKEAEAESDLQAVCEALVDLAYDGLIIARSSVSDRLIAYLRQHQVNFVLFGTPQRGVDDINFVDTDNYAAFYQISQHLMSLGHRYIAFLNGDCEFTYARQREQGFRAAAQDRGISLREDWFLYGKPTRGVGSLMAAEMLKQKDVPTAFICATDELASGVVDTLRSIGLLAGNDISVTGYGSTKGDGSNLTTLGFDWDRAGKELARLIANQVTGASKEPEQIRLPCELILGSSSSEPAPIETIRNTFLASARLLPGNFNSIHGYAGLLSHYERAQQLSGVGSWRYDVHTDTFELSDQACFLLKLPPKLGFQLNDILAQIMVTDVGKFHEAWKRGGSGKHFKVITALGTGHPVSQLMWRGDFVIDNNGQLLCAEGAIQELQAAI